MKVENPAALRFILQDDIYLLGDDKTTADKAVNEPVIATPSQPTAPAVSEPIVETPAVELNYLGQHKKGFLILVHYTGHQFIATDHLTALENILKRKEYNIDDVAILNMATADITDHEQLLAYFNPQRLLILGKDALPQKIDLIALNQPIQLKNITALYSFSFDDMMSNTDNKKAFWDQMKTL